MYGQWKKILSVTLSVLLSFGMIQIPVSAEEEAASEEEVTLEQVETEEQEEGSVFEEITEETEEEPFVVEESQEEEEVIPEVSEETVIEEAEELPEETELPETAEEDPAEALPQGGDIETPEISDDPEPGPAYRYNDYTKVLTVYRIGEDYTYENKPEWYDIRGKVKKIVFEGDALNAERIGDMSFYFFTSLQEVTLPPNLKEIGYEAFYSTKNLNNLELPETLEVLGEYALYNIGAARIDLPASIKSIGNTSLHSYDLKDIYYAGTYEQWLAFNCKYHDASIHTTDYDEIRVQKVTYEVPKVKIPVGFRMQIKTIVTPENAHCQQTESWSSYPNNIVSVDSSGMLTGLNAGKTTVYGNIDGERKSGSFEIEVINNSGKAGKLDWVYENRVLTLSGSGAVPDYSSSEAPWSSFADEIDAVVFGDAVTSIGAGAFKNAAALKAVTLPESMTAVGAGAFEGSGVESVTLSNGVKTIGADAFKDTPLKEVFFTGTEEEWNAIDIQDETLLSDSLLVYKELISVSGLKLNVVSKIVYDLNETFQLVPEVLPENATIPLVRFSSDNEAVATVTDAGDVFLNGYGTAIITVTSIQNPSVYEICTVTVREAKEMGAVTADVEPGTVDAGTIVSLSAEPEDAQIWYSLDGVTIPSPEAENCYLYSEPLNISVDTVIMARAFKDGFTTGDTVYTFAYTMKTPEQLIENEEDYKRYLELDDEAKKGIWAGGMPYEEDIVYTGSPITFDLRLYEGTKLLETGKDYKVSYKNNTKAYTGSLLDKKAPVVTLTGLGGYQFTLNCQFRIYPKDISDESGDIVIKQVFAPYSNKKQNPVPEITHVSGNKALKYNTDFTIDEYQNKNGLTGSGSYTLTLRGKGNYTGEVKAENIAVIVEPDQVSVSKLTISKISACTFDPFAENYECRPKVTVKNGKTVLTESTDGATGDYKVTYQNNKKPGTASVIIEGLGEQFKGSKKVTFKINAVALSKTSITLEKTKFTYNRQPHKITETVVFKDKTGRSVTLIAGKHYTISRTEVTNAGKYTIQFKAVEGSGFTGTVKKTVTVNNASPKNNKRVKIVFMNGKPEAPYSKDGAKVDIRVVYYTGEDPDGYEYIRYINDPTICIPLIEGKDYKITYKNNKTVTKGMNNPAVATVTLIGNYTGSTSYEFYIYAAESLYLSLFASDKAYTGKAGDFKTTPVVYDGSKSLKAGTDYQKLYFTSYYYEYDTTLENGVVRAAGTKVGALDVVPTGTTIRVTMKFQLKGKYVSSSYSVFGYPVPYTELSTTYRVVRGSLSKATCNFSYHGKYLAGRANDYYYTGDPIEPGKDSMEVFVDGVRLKSSDYRIIAYKNNVNMSNVKKKQYASVLIEGTGNYTGRAELKFTIVGMAHVTTTWDEVLEIFGYRKYDNTAVPTL